MSAPTQFDLLGPLPTGHLAIEASAGTGKTYALAALATRFLAERDIATSDLLDRHLHPRRHLGAARPGPRAARRRGGAPRADGEPDRRPVARAPRRRPTVRCASPGSARAVTEFDAATITTIHGFATQVLATLGITSGADPDVDHGRRLRPAGRRVLRRRAGRRGAAPRRGPARPRRRSSSAPARRSTSPDSAWRPAPMSDGSRRRCRPAADRPGAAVHRARCAAGGVPRRRSASTTC